MRASDGRTLWRKAPLLLLRFPYVFAVVLSAAAILSAAGTSGPVFVTASERASLQIDIDQASRWGAGLRISHNVFYLNEAGSPFADEPDEERMADRFDGPAGLVRAIGDAGRQALDRHTSSFEAIGDPIVTYLGSDASVSTPGSASISVRLMNRTDALHHVIRLQGGGSGVWISDVTASQIDATSGDMITITGGGGVADVRVAGIYRFLPLDRPRGYWTPLAEFIYKHSPSDDTFPPAFVIADDDTYFDLLAGVGDFGDVRWELPLASGVPSLETVVGVDRAFQEVRREMTAPTGPVGAVLHDVGLRSPQVDASSLLPGIVASSKERVTTVTPVVGLLSVAVRVVALGAMAAAGYYLVKRRRVEAISLAARGVGPLAQGLRYGLESLFPNMLGAITGVLFGYQIIELIGPAPTLPFGVLSDVWEEVLLTVAVGWVFLVLSAASAVYREERSLAGAHPGAFGSALQVAAVIAVVVGVGVFRLRDEAVASSTEEIGDPMVTAVPVILIACAAVAGAALLRAVLPVIARSLGGAPPPVFLALKRLARGSGMTQVLVTAGASALGIMIYGMTVASSVEQSAVAKAKVFLGSDVSAPVPPNFELPDLPVPATHIVKVGHATLDPGSKWVALLGIDPDTFAEAAYWDAEFGNRPLQDLVDDIRGGSPESPRVIVAGEELPDEPVLSAAAGDVSLDVVARVDAFPGASSEVPLVVMSQEALHRTLTKIGGSVSQRGAELWVKGNPADIEALLQRRGVSIFSTASVDSVLDTPGLKSMLWTLSLLGGLGAAAGVVVFLGLLLYMQARHRAAVISSALTRRMGLSRAKELLAWACEITAASMISFAVAVGVALPVAALMHQRLDLRPNLLPDPILVVPLAVIILVGVAMILLSGLSAWRVRRAIDRADLAQVMRT